MTSYRVARLPKNAYNTVDVPTPLVYTRVNDAVICPCRNSFLFKSSLIFLCNASVACTGAVPSDLGKLSALQDLKLDNNQLSGEAVHGFRILKKSFLLAFSYVVRKNRFLDKRYNERQFVYWSGVVRLLIEKSQFPTKIAKLLGQLFSCISWW